MSLILIGTNHRYAPISVREKLFFSKGALKRALRRLTGQSGINAAVILSTCNRVELYASVSDIDIGISALKSFLAAYQGQELAAIEPYLYIYIGKNIGRHLAKVASGLDSQIIGESQILQQARCAFREAEECACLDEPLRSLFASAFKTAERIRKETGLNKTGLSIGNFTVNLIKEKAGCLKNKNILIIGLGKVSQLLMEYLKEEEASMLFVSGRNFEKAKAISAGIGAQIIKFERLKDRLPEADIIISATASPHFILRKGDLAGVIRKPLFIIDLALPRDIDPQVKDIPGVELYCLDDVKDMANDGLKMKSEIKQAEEIIEAELKNSWSSNAPLELAAVGAL